jgi:hypothetical protein
MSESATAAQVAAAHTTAEDAAAVLQVQGVRDERALHTQGARDAATQGSAGRRVINLMWETTQKQLALLVVLGFMVAHLFNAMAVSLILVLYWRDLTKNPVALAVLVAVLTGSLGAISSMASLIIGFYFSRTNHTRTGGVGPEREEER